MFRKQLALVYIFILSILLLNQYVYSSFYTNNDFLEDNFLFFNLKVNKHDKNLSDFALSKENIFDNETIWSVPSQITAPKISRNEYVVCQGKDGRFHCVWLKKLSLYGNLLEYSFTNSKDDKNWSVPVIIADFQPEITFLSIINDQNDTLHVAYISNKENFWQINYFNKKINETWSNLEFLYRTNVYKYSNLQLIQPNNSNICNLVWIAKVRELSEVNIDSEIQSLYKNLKTNKWSEKKVFFNDSDPLNFNIVSSNKSLNLIITKWDENKEGNEIYITNSTDFGNSWLELKYLYVVNTKIDNLLLYSSLITNYFHILWNIYRSPKKIFYMELYPNYAIKTNPLLISYLYNDAHLIGFYENNFSKDLFVFYEEEISNKQNLYVKTRINLNSTWEISKKLTEDGNSFSGSFLKNSNLTSSTCGYVFYLNYNFLVSSSFNNDSKLTNKVIIYAATEYNDKSSLVVDSNKTIHLLWEHNYGFNSEIYYQFKPYNHSWIFFGSILSIDILKAKNPMLLVDSFNNLHCLFIADEKISDTDGFFYVTKNINQSNWSIPILIKNPDGVAQQENSKILIDNNNTIHFIWTEQTGTYQNKLLYSFKKQNENNFTTENVQINSGPTSVYNPNFVIDSYNGIHLVYTELDRNNGINYINYRSKLVNLNWTTAEIIIASSQYGLYNPLLTMDFENNLWMIYLKKYFNGLFITSDVILWHKKYLENWKIDSVLFSNELINYHTFFTFENKYLFYCHHVTNKPDDKFPETFEEAVMITYTNTSGNWVDREILFLNPNFPYKPNAIYDNVTKNMYLIIYDRRTQNPQMHFLMRQDDTDKDFLGDEDEVNFSTNIVNKDSDNDSLEDGYEIRTSFTNPKSNDTDWDNITDGIEVLIYKSNPLKQDTDGDKISDGDEINLWKTNATSSDTDNDGLTDYDELFIYNTNPKNLDTEPDGMPDYWEIINFLNPIKDDSYNDTDFDNLYNIEEYWANTNPHNNDTDQDGLSDGSEVKIWLTNPLNIDTDYDTLTDSDEVLIFHTNPLAADSDGDGYTDREEINSGTDPNDPYDNINIRKIRKLLLSLVLPLGLFVLISLFLEIRFQIKSKRLAKNEINELLFEENKIKKITKLKKKK